MFTLLETNTATDNFDFLFKLKTVLETDGWTTEYYGDNLIKGVAKGDKLVVSKNSNYYYFAASLNESPYYYTKKWTTFDGIACYPWHEYTTEDFGRDQLSALNYSSVLTSRTDGFIENYWIYKNEDEGFLVILEYNVGQFSSFYFGDVRIFDSGRTIAQCVSMNQSSSSQPDDYDWQGLFNENKTIVYYNGLYYQNDGQPINVLAADKKELHNDSYVNESYNIDSNFPGFSLNHPGGGYVEDSIMACSKVKFNDKNFPIPVKVWIKDLDHGFYFPFFEINGYYTINFETIATKEVLTFGTISFTCYPFYQKLSPQDYTNKLSRGLGIAVKTSN